MPKILVTGASGFVGKSLTAELFRQGYAIGAAVRSKKSQIYNAEVVVVGEIDGNTDWTNALRNVDVVIHLAARVHVMKESFANPLAEFRKVNVEGTQHLAKFAASVDVKRFIFISSIKVNGEFTELDQPFTAKDAANPQDAYATSKYEAEQGLTRIAEETSMEVVNIRPPLVYGADVNANFGSLLRIVKRGMPLPLGAITQNRRSFVALDNLIDLIITCINHPNAADQTFLVSDDEDVSTTDLLRKMAVAQGVPNRLLPVPVALLNSCAKLFGKQAIAQRLLGNLQVDISHTQKLLNWQPIISLDEGLRRAVINLK